MDLNNSNNDSITAENLQNIVIDILEQNKASDIISIDISDKSNIAKYMVIASGNSNKHVKSLAEYVRKSLKRYSKLYIEGLEDGNWVVITIRDILIHIFKPEVREYYKLEDLWNCDNKVNDISGESV